MKCAFCGREIPKGEGILYVRANGQVLYFCSHKCKANYLKLRRNPRKVKWTEAYRAFHRKQAPKAKEAKKGKG